MFPRSQDCDNHSTRNEQYVKKILYVSSNAMGFQPALNFAGGARAEAAASRRAGFMRSGCKVEVRKLKSYCAFRIRFLRNGSVPGVRTTVTVLAFEKAPEIKVASSLKRL